MDNIEYTDEPSVHTRRHNWKGEIALGLGVVAFAVFGTFYKTHDANVDSSAQKAKVEFKGAKVEFSDCLKHQNALAQLTLEESGKFQNNVMVLRTSTHDGGQSIKSIYERPLDLTDPQNKTSHIITFTESGSEILGKRTIDQAEFTAPQKSVFRAMDLCKTASIPTIK